jgi:hypothetical protein
VQYIFFRQSYGFRDKYKGGNSTESLRYAYTSYLVIKDPKFIQKEVTNLGDFAWQFFPNISISYDQLHLSHIKLRTSAPLKAANSDPNITSRHRYRYYYY